MAATRWRAIRFADPGLVEHRPGRRPDGRAHRRLAMVDGDEAVRQAILLLLTTDPASG